MPTTVFERHFAGLDTEVHHETATEGHDQHGPLAPGPAPRHDHWWLVGIVSVVGVASAG